MVAFAGNSILNRMALAEALISPDAFAAIRLASGAMALAVLVSLRQRRFDWLGQGSAVGAAAPRLSRLHDSRLLCVHDHDWIQQIHDSRSRLALALNNFPRVGGYVVTRMHLGVQIH